MAVAEQAGSGGTAPAQRQDHQTADTGTQELLK